ncbi:MAG: hypothetical protein AAF615_09930 [Pseudomonadota bacterium]
MRRNRFERVDEVQDDAITLELAPDGDAEKARVHVPSTMRTEGAEGHDVTEPVAKKDAFRGAIHLANTMKAPIVVMGEEAHWDREWGDLFDPV